MLQTTKIYLDTSVINFLYAEDAPEKKEATTDFFENFIKPSIYKAFVSNVVVAEIEDTRDAIKRNLLLKVIEDYFIEFIEVRNQNEVEFLAKKYIINGIIPEKNIADAYHIAISVIHGINYLVSWNYKHLANVNKERRIRLVNIENNYPDTLRIITPLELIGYEI